MLECDGAESGKSYGSATEPHVPWGRMPDGAWSFAPVGAMLVVASGRLVVCHACGQALTAISRAHLTLHDLDLPGYRVRFGLNRKASLLAPALAQARRQEGRLRWAGNEAVRAGLAVGQQMARSGALYGLGAAAQPAGSRRAQGRRAASREGASPALRADRERRSALARARWRSRAVELGFEEVDAYLADRVAAGATAHRVRTELGCGWPGAVALLASAVGGNGLR